MIGGMPDGLENDPDVAVPVRGPDGDRAEGAMEPARPVYSVTKMFVATAAVKLAESDRIALDTAVCDHVPAAPHDLSLREALTHTGGLPDYVATTRYRAAVDARPGSPWGLDEIPDVGLREGRSGTQGFPLLQRRIGAETAS
jgi:CubicO group peptidase (beta-lactamase class C family)